MQIIEYDKSILTEEAIVNHFTDRLRSDVAPPRCYQLPVVSFDSVVARLCAKIEFGGRGQDGTRDEWITLHCHHGAMKVALNRGMSDGQIAIVPFQSS